ncbi:MAG: sulfatase-like hydrolase/transferase [Acidimicrobiia bacterium]
MRRQIGGISAFAAIPIARLVANNPGERLPVLRLAVYWAVLVVIAGGSVLLVSRSRPLLARRFAIGLSILVFGVTYLAVALRNALGLSATLGIDGAIWLVFAISITGFLISRWNWVQGFVPLLGAFLLLYPVVEIVASPPSRAVTFGSAQEPAVELERAPNVYWFVLDGYGRADVLGEFGDVRQDSFTREMEARGFMIDSRASAAYPMSFLSIASTLSMEYVADANTDVSSEGPFYLVTQGENVVVDSLRDRGYAYVLYPGAPQWSGSQCRGVEDICLAEGGLDPADRALLEMTAAASILRSALQSTDSDRVNPIEVVERLEGHRPSNPFFLFAHVMSPHPPFLWSGPDCDLLERPIGSVFGDWGATSDYLNAIHCLNRQLITTMDRIIDADPEAVIIVQGDHGPDYGVEMLNVEHVWSPGDIRQRFGVLSAIRLPPTCDVPIGTSLVNTFRVVLSCLSGERIPLLPPRAWSGSYGLSDLTEVDPPTR